LGVKAPYLKLDTQGFDLEVLKGANEFLRTIRALQTEVAVQTIYKGMPNYEEMLPSLGKHGFSWSNSFPVSHDPALGLIEFDCIAINKKYGDEISRVVLEKQNTRLSR